MTIQNKTNVYTLWVTERKPHVPVRYEINGFNLLLNAPYDHYFIDYISFKEWKMDPEIMQVPKGERRYLARYTPIVNFTFLKGNQAFT